MGSYTDFKIKCWQEQAGIKPARGAEADLLRQISDKAFELIKVFGDEPISNTAFELIKVIQLEKSGIRDGNGFWYGGDVIGHVRQDMVELCKAKHDYPFSNTSLLKAMVELCTKWIDHERAEWVASNDKAELLERYARKSPKAFRQLDGWLNGDGVTGRDDDGHGTTAGITRELMAAGDVRVLIPLDNDRWFDIRRWATLGVATGTQTCCLW